MAEVIRRNVKYKVMNAATSFLFRIIFYKLDYSSKVV